MKDTNPSVETAKEFLAVFEDVRSRVDHIEQSLQKLEKNRFVLFRNSRISKLQRRLAKERKWYQVVSLASVGIAGGKPRTAVRLLELKLGDILVARRIGSATDAVDRINCVLARLRAAA